MCAARLWTRKIVTGAALGSPFGSKEKEPMSPCDTFADRTPRPTEARVPLERAIEVRDLMRLSGGNNDDALAELFDLLDLAAAD